MPWISRDFDGVKNPYRIFGTRPTIMYLVNYEGEVLENFTWGYPARHLVGKITYGPLFNDSSTRLPEVDSPMHLEPGEGPVEVKITLRWTPEPRQFEGEGI